MINQITNWSVEFKLGEALNYRQVFQLYYQPLCYFAQKILDNQAEAEDIVSETFIKLLNSKLKGIHPAELRSFLFTITRNSCIDFLRKQKIVQKSKNKLLINIDNDNNVIENELVFAQVLQMVHAEILELPEQSRIVFKGIFFEGKTTAILANELSISKQTVLNHKSRALQLLKMALFKKGIHEAVFVTISIFFKKIFFFFS